MIRTNISGRSDDEPFPGDTERPGARNAQGQLAQWTLEDGAILSDPSSDQRSRNCGWNEEQGIRHIGQHCRCLYVIETDWGALAYVEFLDQTRVYAATADCVFD